MKINFIFDLQDGPTGGGNNFLKLLKNKFIQDDLYTEDPNQADIFLFNSHHHIDAVLDIIPVDA